MYASTDPTVIALADQMEAARVDASRHGNRNLLSDPYASNVSRFVCRGLTAYIDEQRYDPVVYPFPNQRAVLVRGDWVSDLLASIDAGDLSRSESFDAMYADPIPDNGDVLSDLGIARCRRCWDERTLRGDAVLAERVIWVHGGGRTVIEFAFCDDCANHLEGECGPLNWRR